ncbi:hypothetical protein GCM10023334_079960 [Nonomuraea thailandensis]
MSGSVAGEASPTVTAKARRLPHAERARDQVTGRPQEGEGWGAPASMRALVLQNCRRDQAFLTVDDRQAAHPLP